MITVRVAGGLRLSEQLRLLALDPNERRSILRKIGREIAKRLKKAIRKTVRESSEQFPDRAERAAKARFFSRTVGMKVTPRQVVIFDKGLVHERRLGSGATEQQARRLRQLGFRLSRGYIMRNFSQGTAGLIIREIEQDLRKTRLEAGLSARKAPGKKRGGSLVLMVWRRTHEQILAAVDIPNIIRRELALR